MVNNLQDKYCIVGVGETEYTHGSERSTRVMAVEAVGNAKADAGLTSQDVDGLLSSHGRDSTPSSGSVMWDLSLRPNFFMDCGGGGASTEGMVGLAMGAIEAGMCNTVAIYRSFNVSSHIRDGRPGPPAAAPPAGPAVMVLPYGLITPLQTFAFTFTRHMMEYGVTSEHLAQIKAAQSNHASNNPKAIMKQRVTAEDVLNSRWIIKPCAHLLDCCLETDCAICIIVTSAERARDLKQRPIHMLGVQGRGTRASGDYYHHFGPMSSSAGRDVSRRLFDMAGVSHEDIDVTGCWDPYTYTPLILFEDYGYCEKGEAKDYVSSGIIKLGGKRPNNTSGGHLCEGYTNGMSTVVEIVRQLRGKADDYCPRWQEVIHSYDYAEGKCRQVKDAEIGMSMGWAGASYVSSLILGT